MKMEKPVQKGNGDEKDPIKAKQDELAQARATRDAFPETVPMLPTEAVLTEYATIQFKTESGTLYEFVRQEDGSYVLRNEDTGVETGIPKEETDELVLKVDDRLMFQGVHVTTGYITKIYPPKV